MNEISEETDKLIIAGCLYMWFLAWYGMVSYSDGGIMEGNSACCWI